MTADPMTLLAIAGMAIATYLTRVAGFYLLNGVAVKGRLKAALDALPPAILMAVIAPTITSGWREALAAAITAAAAFMRLPMVVTIILGVASLVAIRYFTL
ncbi:AzlD family protein [soil metagenome]